MLFSRDITKPWIQAESEERKRHILERYPEVKPHLRNFARTLADPDSIRQSRHDPKVFMFYRRGTQRRFLAIAVKANARNFVLTAYLTDSIAHPTVVL